MDVYTYMPPTNWVDFWYGACSHFSRRYFKQHTQEIAIVIAIAITHSVGLSSDAVT